ncbi:nucleotide-binding universal stress UspA family protein [Hymenobacter luteus]|uniref:Nucleotide-binding universal stress UspA family protein n=2 Tax=Hymenobacter TaxID=89966 RepID=A0A7W9SZS2_9BACT|nr:MULTISPECIES: universal stress protein [Hymenobacter]MBB4601027.1 nucleotide-binding universal stress UspA family protein [Hymenobacter latericoloratus]MBB6058766.1 nucleotide-binding universal stress UspA family protein [Hymenobacter luteus]
MAAPFLVLTDFTPAADHALRYAAALAAATEAALVVLHVRRETLLDPDAFNGSIRHLSEGEIAAALQQRVQPLGVSTTVESAVEGVEAAVTDAVRRHAPALVVLGKPNTDTTPDELVSTTSLKLLRATRTPLLVIPIGSEAAVPPHCVTIAADNSSFDLKEQSAGAQAMLQKLQPHLTVAHVAEPEDSDTCQSALTAVTTSGLLAGNNFRVHCHGTRHRRIPLGILQAAAETKADLLVLVARRRSFLGQLFNRSITAQVVLHGHLPMLLLPSLG